MSRLKRVLIILTTVVVVIGLALGGGVLYLYSDAEVSTVGTEFRTELAVPPLAKSTVKRDGTRLFELTMQAGQKEFRAGEADTHLGLQRRLPRADAAGEARREGRR